MTEPMTDERLREIEAREKGATEGPWLRGGPYPGVSVCIVSDPGCGLPDPEPPTWDPICVLDQRTSGEESPRAVANADFISHSRTDVPDLIAEVKRLRQMVVELEERANDRDIEKND